MQLTIDRVVKRVERLRHDALTIGRKCAERSCAKNVSLGRVFCAPACACKYTARKRKKIDPVVLNYFHNTLRVSRKESAKVFGVSVNGINNVLNRKGLFRKELPAICIRAGCGKPAIHFKHVSGWLAGNLCREHRAEKQREYTRAYKLRKGWKPLDAEGRAKHAGQASLARWAKTTKQRAQKKKARRAEIDARIRERKERTACANGHPWTKESTYIKKTGGKACRVCTKLATRRLRAKRND